MERAIMCPQCNAPLAPHHFARSIVCSYCGATVQLDEAAVSAEPFHKTFRTWNSPASYGISSWVSIGDSHWTVEKKIAGGDISDVYTGRRARWPTELVILKFLRDRAEKKVFDNEWQVLQTLQRSDAPGADTFRRLLPQQVIHGDVSPGQHAGERLSIFRWACGFHHTFEAVRQAYPQGIPAKSSIWAWRRILEMLSFIHAAGLVHGAVLPPHLLIQENEHGVRLLGYGCAGRTGEKLPKVSRDHEAFYPPTLKSKLTLTPQLDLVMSARCLAAILGGDPETASLPKSVPVKLAAIVQRVAMSDPTTSTGGQAWAIREELGQLALDAFGPSTFNPIVMPPG